MGPLLFNPTSYNHFPPFPTIYYKCVFVNWHSPQINTYSSARPTKKTKLNKPPIPPHLNRPNNLAKKKKKNKNQANWIMFGVDFKASKSMIEKY